MNIRLRLVVSHLEHSTPQKDGEEYVIYLCTYMVARTVGFPW